MGREVFSKGFQNRFFQLFHPLAGEIICVPEFLESGSALKSSGYWSLRKKSTAIRKSKIRLAVNTLRVPESKASTKLSRARVIVEVMAAYRKEMKLLASGRYHAAMARTAANLGLEEVVFHNEDFTSHDRAGDIILASSSVPPMVRFQTMNGAYFVDGGITRNLALDLLEPVDVAIGIYYDFWARLQYERISVADPAGEIEMQDQGGRVRARRVLFLSPDRRLPIDTWDYANPRGVAIAYEAGRRAGEHLLQAVRKI